MNTDAVQFLVLTVAGWMNRRQQLAIDYLVDLPGDNRRPMGGGQVSIALDAQGNFASVEANGNTYSLDAWNGTCQRV